MTQFMSLVQSNYFRTVCTQFLNYTFCRQHGIPIKSEMAVVIQKMVPAEAAGVLFTWHPTTSNPSQMVVTSNFGLGEVMPQVINFLNVNEFLFWVFRAWFQANRTQTPLF